jgi:DNA modification methylase
MRQIVRASLPLGTGVVLDPFMGAGSTIAAAVAVGHDSIGIELDDVFFKMAAESIPSLAGLNVSRKNNIHAGTPGRALAQHKLALGIES